MKVIIVFACLAAVAFAAPQSGPEAKILRYDNENIGVDGYNFAFETSDPIQREEKGELKNAGSENEAIEVHGSYSYTDAQGKKVTVEFVSDENGYRPRVTIS